MPAESVCPVYVDGKQVARLSTNPLAPACVRACSDGMSSIDISVSFHVAESCEHHRHANQLVEQLLVEISIAVKMHDNCKVRALAAIRRAVQQR